MGSRTQLLARLVEEGIRDRRVLAAIGALDRHRFVPPERAAQAEEDRALPIGFEQTISQPYVVARMTEELVLQGHERVLEIGTGSGYQAAVLAQLVREVFTVEIIPELAARAQTLFEALGLTHIIKGRVGDGYPGWPEEAPFDGILLTAAPELMPTHLVEQLTRTGRLVAPVGAVAGSQELVRMERGPRPGEPRVTELLPVQFVPMTGAAVLAQGKRGRATRGV